MEPNHAPNGVCCDQLRDQTADDDIPILFIRRYREYGIRVLDGGDSFIRLLYCPWCGTRLPDSLRLAWFAELEKRGLEPGDPAIPDELQSESWWEQPRD